MRFVETIFTTFTSYFSAFRVVSIQGHRGARGLYPENSLPAFSSAIEAGVDVLEMDLLLTRDGAIIIHHNFYINPKICHYKDGKEIVFTPLIRNVTLEEIKRIDCGKGNSSYERQVPVPNTEIPTLQEVFELIKTHSHPHARHIRLNLEIKVDPVFSHFTSSPKEFVKRVLEVVEGSGLEDRIYFSSFDYCVLQEIKMLNPRFDVGFLVSERSLNIAWKLKQDEWLNFALQVGADVDAQLISPEYTLVKESDVHTLAEAGFKVVPWSINDVEVAEEFIRWGVDGMISDYPHDLVHLRSCEKVIK